MNQLMTILTITLMYSTPLVFGAMGGVISEKSGVVNIGIEGMMAVGAFTAASVSYYTGSPWIGFFSGGIAGALVGLLHAIASVSFRADQTVSGIAINMIGSGLTLFMANLLFGGANSPVLQKKMPKIFGIDSPAIIALICVVLLWVFLYRTKWGLRVLAVGEHPAAADTLGVNVYKIRYLSVIASGFFSGLGGAAVTVSLISNFTPTSITGQGFIALAAVIFGKWTPHGAYGAALMFGFAQALAIYLGAGSSIPSQFYAMLPFVLTLVVLILVGKSEAPRADGQPYVKGVR